LLLRGSLALALVDIAKDVCNEGTVGYSVPSRIFEDDTSVHYFAEKNHGIWHLSHDSLLNLCFTLNSAAEVLLHILALLVL
jgi:hypothetical protein